MTDSYVDIRVWFDSDVEDFDGEEITFYSVKSAQRVGSNIDYADLTNIAETAA